MNLDALSSSDARRILKAAATGSAPAEYARLLLVGQKKWLETAVRMMDDTAEDKDFEVRFVRARYGGGKTHFLYCLEQEAREKGWATSFVLLKRDLVELDKFSSFAREVAKTVSLPDGTVGVPGLVRKALATHAGHHGIAPGKTVSLMIHDRAHRDLTDFCSRNFISPPLSTALLAAYKAMFSDSRPQVDQLLEWLRGEDATVVIETRFTSGGAAIKLKPLASSLAEEHLRFISLLTQLAGQKGLLIGVDELELIGRLPGQRKINSFQTLRALVDQNNSRRQPPSTSLFLAATPEMFEDADKFPSYKALQDRIESLPSLGGGGSVNYRATVIDLDKTALASEDLRTLAHTLVKLHRLAEREVPQNIDSRIDSIVAQVATGKYIMARPRLLCRCVTDLLNGHLIGDLSHAVAARAKDLQDYREKELAAT